jgi:hypothetical protein
MDDKAPYSAPHMHPSQIGHFDEKERPKALKLATDDPTFSGWRIIKSGEVTHAPLKMLHIPVAYEWAVKWPKYAALVLFNTTYAPCPPIPDYQGTYIMTDGLWGRRDFTTEPHLYDHLSPHLALFPVPQVDKDYVHILFRLPSNRECVRSTSPDSRGRFLLALPLLEEVSDLLRRISDTAHKGKRWIKRVLKANEHLAETSRRVRMILEGRFPSSIEANMFELLKILAGRGTESRSDLIMVWVAMQRCARELIAYASFCCYFVPSTTARLELENHLQCESMLGGLPFRGSIFTGSDLELIDEFIALNLPAYAFLWRKEYIVDPDRFTPTKDARTSIEVDGELSMYFSLISCNFYYTYFTFRRKLRWSSSPATYYMRSPAAPDARFPI